MKTFYIYLDSELELHYSLFKLELSYVTWKLVGTLTGDFTEEKLTEFPPVNTGSVVLSNGGKHIKVLNIKLF